MRIGLISGEYPPMQGGVGAFTRRLGQHLVSPDHDVFIFSGKDALPQEAGPVVSINKQNWSWRMIAPIRKWVKQNHLDIINLQFQTAAYHMSPWINLMPHIMQKPVVTTFHDLRYPYLFPKAGPLRPWIVQYLARKSAGVIVTNDEDFRDLRSVADATMIPIGSNIQAEASDADTTETFRSKAGADKDSLLLAYFGFMNHSKGVDTLLDAAATLRDEGLPVRIVMIGGRTGASDASNLSYADMIDHKASELNLADAIFWTDFVDDEAVQAYLYAADLVVLPFRDGASYRRGSLMAAIHAARPIITTIPALPLPTFVHEENLYLIPPESSERLAYAIKDLAANPDKRERLMRGAAQLAHNFEWDSIASQTLAYYEKILSRQRVQVR